MYFLAVIMDDQQSASSLHIEHSGKGMGSTIGQFCMLFHVVLYAVA